MVFPRDIVYFHVFSTLQQEIIVLPHLPLETLTDQPFNDRFALLSNPIANLSSQLVPNINYYQATSSHQTKQPSPRIKTFVLSSSKKKATTSLIPGRHFCYWFSFRRNIPPHGISDEDVRYFQRNFHIDSKAMHLLRIIEGTMFLVPPHSFHLQLSPPAPRRPAHHSFYRFALSFRALPSLFYTLFPSFSSYTATRLSIS